MVPLFEVLTRLSSRTAELPSIVPALSGEALVDQCARHGLSVWVADGLAAANAKLPEPHQAHLLRDARQTVAMGTKHRRLLHAALDALAAERITPILLKGYGLATRLYPQPLGRPSTDVDVLVLPEELPLVRRALAGLELRQTHDDGLKDVFEEHHHLSFSGRAGLVEVHFRLFTGFGGGVFEDRGLWARSTLATLDGRQVRYLAPEDEFIYLAIHAANHAYLRVSWLVDLERFLATQRPLDWSAAARRAQEAGFSRALAVTLAVLEQALELRLPQGARALAASLPALAPLDRELFSPARLAGARLAEGRLGNFLVRLWLVDGPRYGLRHLLDGARRSLRRGRREA